MSEAEMIQQAQMEINQNLRRLSRLKLEKKEGRIKRNINWILALWGYHLQKYPHPYHKKPKLLMTPGEIEQKILEGRKCPDHGLEYVRRCAVCTYIKRTNKPKLPFKE